jgi:DNA-directed RNA polymerase subunit H (RpoH/RPB5)
VQTGLALKTREGTVDKIIDVAITSEDIALCTKQGGSKLTPFHDPILKALQKCDGTIISILLGSTFIAVKRKNTPHIFIKLPNEIQAALRQYDIDKTMLPIDFKLDCKTVPP